MPLLTVRLSESEHERVKRAARAQGVSMSDLVKRQLGLIRSEGSSQRDEWRGAVDDRFEDFERRVSRLEQMALGGL
jgi:HicB family